jgi:hypothetical protein
MSVPVGTHAIVMEGALDDSSRLLLNPLPKQYLKSLAGQTVTVAAWMWADRPVTAVEPKILWFVPAEQRLRGGPNRPVHLTTTPTFVARRLQLPAEPRMLYYAFVGGVDAEGAGGPTRISLDGAVVVTGEFPDGTAPLFDDESGSAGTWAGRRFTNLLRNGSVEGAWPSLRLWAAQFGARYMPVDVGYRLSVVLNPDRIRRLWAPGADQALLYGFAGMFAWSNVRLPAEPFLTLARGLVLIAALGCVTWLLRSRATPSVRLTVVFVSIAAALVWGIALLMPLTIFWEPLISPPTVRYTFPVVIPAVLALLCGWLALWPRRYRSPAALLFVIGFFALDAVAIQTIAGYYSALR